MSFEFRKWALPFVFSCVADMIMVWLRCGDVIHL